MALREYKCTSCGRVDEVIINASDPIPETRACSKCGLTSQYKPLSTFGLIRSSFSESPIDIKVGFDAEKRWEVYNQRQAERNSVRAASGSLGLTMEGDGTYVPISDETRALRERGSEARTQGTPEDPEMVTIKSSPTS